MPFTAGDLVDDILNRVRDPSAGANTRAFVRLILTNVQRLLNAKFGIVLAQTALTTNPSQQVYAITASVATAMRIVGVREDTRDLVEVAWHTLWYIKRGWIRRIGTAFEVFSLVGRDLLIIYPAKSTAGTVTLVYATLTDDLATDATAIQITDDYVPLLLDWTEVILLLKSRLYAPIGRVTDAIKNRMAT
jgi:uncharacterized protein YcfL